MKALRRRYGRASNSGKARVVLRMPNVTLWRAELKGGGHGFFMWSPGGRLRFSLADPRKPGTLMPNPIWHHTADGDYNTEREAAAAMRSFLHSETTVYHPHGA